MKERKRNEFPEKLFQTYRCPDEASQIVIEFSLHVWRSNNWFPLNMHSKRYNSWILSPHFSIIILPNIKFNSFLITCISHKIQNINSSKNYLVEISFTFLEFFDLIFGYQFFHWILLSHRSYLTNQLDTRFPVRRLSAPRRKEEKKVIQRSVDLELERYHLQGKASKEYWRWKLTENWCQDFNLTGMRI